MTRYWKTNIEASPRKHVQWPTLGQIIRQLSIILVIGLVWAGLFVGWANLSSKSTPQTQLKPTAATTGLAVIPSNTPAPPATDTPTPSPTPTPEPTVSPESSAAPSNTPEPTLTPSETPVPPTNTPTPQPVEESRPVSFANDVRPILERRCLKCHGGDKVENGLSMQSHETLMKGSWNGTVITPGDIEGS